MIAPNIRCVVVEVPVALRTRSGDLNAGPQDLLPWADPYIARLVENHRAAIDLCRVRRGNSRLSERRLHGEAPPPLLSPDLDFTHGDREGWDHQDDVS